MCNQELVDTSLLYRMEPKQLGMLKRNGEQPEVL